MTLKSLRYLLQFMAIHNILVHLNDPTTVFAIVNSSIGNFNPYAKLSSFVRTKSLMSFTTMPLQPQTYVHEVLIYKISSVIS